MRVKTGRAGEGEAVHAPAFVTGMHRAIGQKVVSRITHGVHAVSDTYLSLKDIFERHKVVLTIAASIGSAGAAWAGYSARQLHQKRVEARLDTIEHVMASVHNLEQQQVKSLTSPGVSFTTCAATAGTTLVIGYGLGWRGGRWHTIKKIQKQQQKLLAPPKTSRLSRLKASLRLRNRGFSKSMEAVSSKEEAPCKELAISKESS